MTLEKNTACENKIFNNEEIIYLLLVPSKKFFFAQAHTDIRRTKIFQK